MLRHKCFGHGVVYGWDERCAAPEEWIRRNQIASEGRGRDQPFYQMLFSDGNARYCSQENLAIDANANPVRHEFIEHLFNGFDAAVRQYEPSPELATRFPDDMELLRARQRALLPLPLGDVKVAQVEGAAD